MLYENLAFIMPANILCASLVLISFTLITHNTHIWYWYVATVLVSILRWGLPHFYLIHTTKNTPRLVFFISGVIISAALWGLIASVLLPPNNTLQQMIVIVIIAGITAAGTQSLQPSLIASILYIIIIVFPLSIWLFLQMGSAYLILSLSMLLYILTMIIISLRSHKELKRTLLLRYENSELLNQLSIANNEIHQSLLASESDAQTLKNILDHAPIGMSILSLDGKILQANHALLHTLGYTSAELKNLSSEDIIFSDDLDKDITIKNHLLSGKPIPTQIEKRYVHKNGSLIWVNTNTSLTRNSLGEPLHFIIQIEDISKKKRTEALLEELHQKTDANLAELKQRDVDMGYINKMSDLLHVCQNFNEAIPIISNTVQNIFPALSGGFIVYDASDLNMKTILQWGAHPILKPVFNLDDCWALRSSSINIVNDIKIDLICYHFESPPQGACMCLPLISHVGLIGMLFLNAAPDNKITDNQIQLAITVSEIIKLFLANIQLRTNLHEQSIRDTLTGLFNRRYLDELLPIEMHHVIHEQLPLCVAMIDIDHFKIFNDTYGHDAGDAVLKHLGALIKKSFRRGDIPFRFGGEEFVAILINSELSGALPRLQIFCDKVKSTRLPFKDLLLPQITVSIGVAEAPIHGTTAKEILRAADEALYAAKNGGRDRIEVYQVNAPSE